MIIPTWRYTQCIQPNINHHHETPLCHPVSKVTTWLGPIRCNVVAIASLHKKPPETLILLNNLTHIESVHKHFSFVSRQTTLHRNFNDWNLLVMPANCTFLYVTIITTSRNIIMVYYEWQMRPFVINKCLLSYPLETIFVHLTCLKKYKNYTFAI